MILSSEDTRSPVVVVVVVVVVVDHEQFPAQGQWLVRITVRIPDWDFIENHGTTSYQWGTANQSRLVAGQLPLKPSLRLH